MIQFLFKKNRIIILKNQLKKMSNQQLLVSWIKIRIINKNCIPHSKNECKTCKWENNCRQYLLFEELYSEELRCRGMLYLGLSFLQQEHIYENWEQKLLLGKQALQNHGSKDN